MSLALAADSTADSAGRLRLAAPLSTLIGGGRRGMGPGDVGMGGMAMRGGGISADDFGDDFGPE